MNVKELIELLSKMPQDENVVVNSDMICKEITTESIREYDKRVVIDADLLAGYYD